MKNVMINIFLLVIAIVDGLYAYTKLEGHWAMCFMFISGLLVGMFLMNLKLFVKNDKINSYKRELEKESISSEENSAKVKVLENKIKVLEKALENALHK